MEASSAVQVEPLRRRTCKTAHPQRPLMDAYAAQTARHDDGDRLPAPDRLMAALDFSHAGLTLAVDGAPDHRYDHAPDRGSVRMIIVDDATGQQAGYLHRNLRLDRGQLISYDGRFRLEPRYQGRGFATAFTAHIDACYTALGVRRSELCAIEHGAYAWAKPGVLFDPQRLDYKMRDYAADPQHAGAATAHQLHKQMFWRLEHAAHDGLIDPAHVQAFSRRFATAKDLEHPTRWQTKLATPWEIVSYGRNLPFCDADGRRTWPGEYFMLGRESDAFEDGCRGRGMVWSGVKLHNP